MSNDATEKPEELTEQQFSVIHSMAYLFLRHKQYNKAGALLKLLNQQDPDHQQVILSLSFVLTKIEHIDDAQSLIQPLLDNTASSSPLLHLLQAKILIKKNQIKDAARQLEHYIK